MKPDKLPQEEQDAILSLVKDYEDADRPTRETQIRLWKKHENFWKGIQDAFWNEVARDYQLPSSVLPIEGENAWVSAKIINIYKAHGENIIAALGGNLPDLRFAPDNADNISDKVTAKAASKVSELIDEDNDADLLFLRSLFLTYNQGLVASYTDHFFSKEYGIIKRPIYGEKPFQFEESFCPSCGYTVSENPPIPVMEGNLLPESTSLGGIQQTQPGIPQPFGQNGGMQDPTGQLQPQGLCPHCGSPTISSSWVENAPVVKGYDEVPKGKQLIEVYGPMNVKVPHYIRKQKETPYLILETEHNFSLIKHLYPWLREKIEPTSADASQERWARRSSDLISDTGKQQLTSKRAWLRNWALEAINDDKIRDSLLKKFPQGMYAVVLDVSGSGNTQGILAEVLDEDLDQHWTLTHNPLYSHIHADPLGKSLLSIQEMRNETVELTIETIRYGIPETFADPNALDFQKYGETESRPGSVFPAVSPNPESPLEKSFHSIKNATLSKEVPLFQQSLDADAQFVSHDLPSLYGGAMEGGGKTAFEYGTSKQQALQSLGIVWKVLTKWWAETKKKSVMSFMKNMIEDTYYVKGEGPEFINIWIRRHEVQGSIGRVYAENADQFPITWTEKRQILFDLISLGNPAIESAIFSPDNMALTARMIGLPELKVPGEAQRDKQLSEIDELLQGVAIEGPMGLMASIPLDPVDNDEMHIQTIDSWAVSEAGQMMKRKNPNGYANIMAHRQMHEFRMQQKMMAQIAADSSQNGTANSSNGKQTNRGPMTRTKDASQAVNKQSTPPVNPPRNLSNIESGMAN